MEMFTLASALANVLSAVEDVHLGDKGLSAPWSFGQGAPRPIRQAKEHECPHVHQCTHERMAPLDSYCSSLEHF